MFWCIGFIPNHSGATASTCADFILKAPAPQTPARINPDGTWRLWPPWPIWHAHKIEPKKSILHHTAMPCESKSTYRLRPIYIYGLLGSWKIYYIRKKTWCFHWVWSGSHGWEISRCHTWAEPGKPRRRRRPFRWDHPAHNWYQPTAQWQSSRTCPGDGRQILSESGGEIILMGSFMFTYALLKSKFGIGFYRWSDTFLETLRYSMQKVWCNVENKVVAYPKPLKLHKWGRVWQTKVTKGAILN